MWKRIVLTITLSTAFLNPFLNMELAQAAEEPRNFYDVLDDVLGDFEYDLKNGNISGLKNISIRNIVLSENVPPSFKSHLDLLITERILRDSRTHVIQCLPCKAHKTTLNGDQVVVSSPDTNPAELARIAKISGIDHFLDISFTYESTGIVLSMYITDPETESINWSRSYNSESSRAAAFRRGVDYTQIDDARKKTEYSPQVQHRLTLYYLSEPSLPRNVGCLALGYRMMERYDNRKKEVGFELDYMADAGSLISSSSSPNTNIYNGIGFNLHLLFLHTWSFIGEEENYNKIRGSLTAGIGGSYAPGYLSGLIRLSYDFRLAKHFALSTVLGYRPPSTAFLATQPTGTITGLEYGLGVNFLF